MSKSYFIICHNKNCCKKIKLSLSESNERKYCSHKCSNFVNNILKKVFRVCPTCKNLFSGDRKYCSISCVKVVGKPKYSSNDLIVEIKNFYNIHNRIPTKREFSSRWRPILRVFGSWNNAVIHAGFIPNNVVFSKKHLANDGHLCDSFSEKIIDDWLYERKVPHQIHVSYPDQKKFKCDFLIKNLYWIEYIGLTGHKKYEEVLKRKKILLEKLDIKIIEIYSADLYPSLNLTNKISHIL